MGRARSLVPLHRTFAHLAENNISLAHLGLHNGSIVSVECLPAASERVPLLFLLHLTCLTWSHSVLQSWAWEMFLRRQKLLEIFVTDKCSGEDPFPTITVEVDKKATLGELKAAVLTKMPVGTLQPHCFWLLVWFGLDFRKRFVWLSGLLDPTLETQLRRSLPGGGEGHVYAKPDQTLVELGIKDGDRIILEHGWHSPFSACRGLFLPATEKTGFPLIVLLMQAIRASQCLSWACGSWWPSPGAANVRCPTRSTWMSLEMPPSRDGAYYALFALASANQGVTDSSLLSPPLSSKQGDDVRHVQQACVTLSPAPHRYLGFSRPPFRRRDPYARRSQGPRWRHSLAGGRQGPFRCICPVHRLLAALICSVLCHHSLQ